MNDNKTYASFGVSAIVLALFAVGFSSVKARPQAIASPQAVPTPAPSPTPDASIVEAEVKMAVEQADQAEIDALRSGNTTGLERYFTGEALKHEEKMVERLVVAQQRQESTLHKITFDSVRVHSGGNSATVRVTERWSDETFDAKTNAKLGSSEPRDLPQTVSLTRQSGEGWRVAAISWDRQVPDPEPTPMPIRERDGDDVKEADDSVRDELQARYNQRAAAFVRRDLDGYFDYADPEWTWESEDGDRSTLAESREYYRKVFDKGESRALETRILKVYRAGENVVLAQVLVGTARAGDQGRLIHQLDGWIRRDGRWYCIRERRLDHTGTFEIEKLRDALEKIS